MYGDISLNIDIFCTKLLYSAGDSSKVLCAGKALLMTKLSVPILRFKLGS